jgi:hypothetical protein
MLATLRWILEAITHGHCIILIVGRSDFNDNCFETLLALKNQDIKA